MEGFVVVVVFGEGKEDGESFDGVLEFVVD